jgi:hypothetical protein
MLAFVSPSSLHAISRVQIEPAEAVAVTLVGTGKNRNYSQMEGREELFERERHKEPVAGWHSCELACAEVEQ